MMLRSCDVDIFLGCSEIFFGHSSGIPNAFLRTPEFFVTAVSALASVWQRTKIDRCGNPGCSYYAPPLGTIPQVNRA